MLAKLNFALLLLLREKHKHLAIFLLSTLLISILSSVLFISSSIEEELLTTLDTQADFTIQRFEAGQRLNTPEAWINEFLSIDGVSKVEGRVYGTHYYEPKEEHFLIYGLDFYDTSISKNFQTLLNDLNISKFLQRKNMLIGQGVKEFFDTYAYFDYYIFRPPDRSKEKVYIYNALPIETSLLSNDMILMDIDEAHTILGIQKGFVSDIVLEVKNEKEREKVYEKILVSHFNTRIITKDDIKKHFKNIFNYKGGIFVSLYIVALITFMLILYQRYSMIQESDVREIAILRLSGWSIEEILSFKLIENIIIILFAFVGGVNLAYFYVYFLHAPILKDIFLGNDNLANIITFAPTLNINDFLLLFSLFSIPFILSIIIPLWKLCVKDISEIL